MSIGVGFGPWGLKLNTSMAGANSNVGPPPFPALDWWYEMDIANLFQDNARTTPVTGIGDPVGSVTDLSGADRHLFQSDPPSRPLYGTDATGDHIVSTGLEYLFRNAVGGEPIFSQGTAFGVVGFGLGTWLQVGDFPQDLNVTGGLGDFTVTNEATALQVATPGDVVTRLLSFRFGAGGECELFVNGVAANSDNIGAVSCSLSLFIPAKESGAAYNGTFYACLGTTEVLSDAQMALVHAYILTKYGL